MVMVIGYRATAMRRDLRGVADLLFYVQQSFVAAVFSSSGALIWSYTNGYDRTALLPVWQGWWLGGFVQSVVLVGPVMAALWPRIRRWQEAHPHCCAMAISVRAKPCLACSLPSRSAC
jgi:hypothetical protein